MDDDAPPLFGNVQDAPRPVTIRDERSVGALLGEAFEAGLKFLENRWYRFHPDHVQAEGRIFVALLTQVRADMQHRFDVPQESVQGRWRPSKPGEEPPHAEEITTWVPSRSGGCPAAARRAGKSRRAYHATERQRDAMRYPKGAVPTR